MDKYEENFPVSSASSVILALPFALLVVSGELHAESDPVVPVDMYEVSETSASNGAAIKEIVLQSQNTGNFQQNLTKVFRSIAENQEALGSDIEAILDESLDELYES